MKGVFIILCCFFLYCASAQKRYESVVYTRANENSFENRFVGKLVSISDTAIYMHLHTGDTVLYWNDLESVKFRKAGAFGNLVLPLSLLAGAGLMKLILDASSASPTDELIEMFNGSIFLTGVFTLPIGTSIYFIARNRTFKIDTYSDFQKLQLLSEKYKFKRQKNS